MKNLIKMCNEWKAGHQVFLATIIKTRGSTYRKTGAQLVINDKQQHEGLLSGGCLEKDLTERVKRLLDTRNSQEVCSYYNDREDPVFGFNTGCNGDVHILIESAEWLKKYYSKLNKAICQQSDIRIVSSLDENAFFQRMLWIDGERVDHESPREPKTFIKINEPGLHFHDDLHYYVHHFQQNSRMFIWGAGDDALPVAEFSSKLGFEVIVLDYRESLLSGDRFCFPNTRKIIIPSIADVFLEEYGMDRDSFVVIMSHSVKFDSAAITMSLNYGCQYIGVLGPRERLITLLENQPASAKDVIHNPIGLDIAADTPEEITISILGEIIQFKNQKKRMRMFSEGS